MTNKEAYKILKQKVDNKPEDMGILQYADLILNILPSIYYQAKYRPNDIY